MNEAYRQQVALLIRILPLVYQINEFAVHGGTAINLFYKNMPRYSVDIDLTYIPLKNREDSLVEIEVRLLELKQLIEKAIPKIKVTPKLSVCKLQCVKDGATVKVEVNATKRGVLGETTDKILCSKARQDFSMTCEARIVPFSQLYGGKIAAALSRQHPRDVFDYKFMEVKSLEEIKNGLMLCLLGSDKPLIESLQPNRTNQREAMENHLEGMSDIPFSYGDFEDTRKDLVEKVNAMLTSDDKSFLLSFEQGTPSWDKCCAGDLSRYPSVQWKQQNILRLKEINPQKHKTGIEKLTKYFQP
jgi:predicted nucleotidyltransferase component of viral defense system